MWQHPERSKRAREVIKTKVKGKRGVGRVGSVKRKLIELSWLLGLKDDEPNATTEQKLRVNLNNSLFNTNEGPISIVEFMDKLGITQQEITWPEHIIVCTILLPVSTQSDDDNDDDDDSGEGDHVGYDALSSSSEQENEEEEDAVVVGVIDLTSPSPPKARPQSKVIDLTTPIKLIKKDEEEEDDILKFDFRKF